MTMLARAALLAFTLLVASCASHRPTLMDLGLYDPPEKPPEAVVPIAPPAAEAADPN